MVEGYYKCCGERIDREVIDSHVLRFMGDHKGRISKDEFYKAMREIRE